MLSNSCCYESYYETKNEPLRFDQQWKAGNPVNKHQFILNDYWGLSPTVLTYFNFGWNWVLNSSARYFNMQNFSILILSIFKENSYVQSGWNESFVGP